VKRSLLLAALLSVLPAFGQEPDPVQAALKDLKGGKPNQAQLQRAVPLLADPAGRNTIRTAIVTLDPFPSALMVTLLYNSALDVRLGALELLEEKAGGDFGFNPWLPPGDPENDGPLARWQNWTGQKPGTGSSKDLLGEDQRRGYLRDLLGENSDKSSRARRMLEADGLGAVGFLETFLKDSPALPAAGRTKVREAQYQIVLSRSLGPQAAATARQLAFGSRDQTLAALGTLRGAGLGALPILRDFIEHPDPLVRETAIDAMLSSGGAQSLEVVGPVLIAEKDVNVIHGALRRLKEIPGDPSLKIAASFLSHEDEDLLVSAIQACVKLAGGETGGMSSFGRRAGSTTATGSVKEEVGKAVLKALDDPRWRVRTAALEYVAACSLNAAEQRCVELLEDPDEFVRFSAIKAAAALRAEGAKAKLKEMMMKDPAMTGPVFEGYSGLGGQPDEEMLAKLATYPADARLAAVRAAEANPSLISVVIGLAGDPELDVSCAAIRFLSADAERVKTDRVASVLVEALRSGVPEKRSAVLDRLVLGTMRGATDPALSKLLGQYTAPSGEKTALDPLYDSILKAAGEQAPPNRGKTKVIPGAHGELVKAAAEVAASGNTPEAFRAALCLARAGEPNGLQILAKRLPGLSTAQRASIAEQLYNPSRKEALELLQLLLRDPMEEIRTAAASSALSNSNAPAFLSMVLAELGDPEGKLQPHEIYTYHFESAARQNTGSRVLRPWAAKIAAAETVSDPMRILALISMRNGFSTASSEPVLKLAKSSGNRWIRRAAWYALGSAGPPAFRVNLESLATDPAPQVRAVLAEVAGKGESAWLHRFDDTRSLKDTSWYSQRSSRKLAPETKQWLEKLAASDPVPEIRFESMFALLSHGQAIDANTFAVLMGAQPAESAASARVADWMSDNARRLGPGLAPIAAALDTSKVDPDKMQVIAAMVTPKTDQGSGFASFAALAAGAGAIEAAPQQTAEAAPEEAKPAERSTLKLVYFYKPGCAECEKASQLIEIVKKDFPKLEVEEHNIIEAKGTVFNQALCTGFQVPTLKHNISPAIFTQAGFLVKENITPQALGKLLATTMAMPQDDAWSRMAEPEIAAAEKVVEQKFESLTLPIVLGAGLADGVNPCAFATIIFFLSYLQVARRTPREMLMVGAAFILAVFLAYFLAGLALHKVLEQLTGRIAGIKKYLDWIFGGLALLAAFLSFRDAFKARAGKLDEMTLQLPAFLKDRIRGVLRTGAKARRFVIAAFVAGIVISFLELACTGQVYAPIIYSIQQGRKDAVVWLLAYNLAFITPLVAIFLLAFTGMSNKALIHFQTKHTFGVKIALGLVFVVLAWVILFGSRYLLG
jgi:HEAT repeat protein/cytochrome c biogenesis protein CcdA